MSTIIPKVLIKKTIQCATLIKKVLMLPVECIFIGVFSINVWSNRQYGWSLRKAKYLHPTFKHILKNFYGESFSNIIFNIVYEVIK